MNSHIIYTTVSSSFFSTDGSSCFCAVPEQVARDWEVMLGRLGQELELCRGQGLCASVWISSVNSALHAGSFGTLHTVLHALDQYLLPGIFTGFLRIVQRAWKSMHCNAGV